MKSKRLLLISPYYPPTNEVGAKRAINLVQGIQKAEDWEVIVLASNPFKHISKEKSLPRPEGVNVVYGFESRWRPVIRYLVKIFFTKKENTQPNEPAVVRPKKNNFKQPNEKISLTPFDQYFWDVPGALRHGSRIIKEQQPDVIWVNADPWSGLLVGHILSKRHNIPWIADMRDPWTIFKKKMYLRPPVIRRIIHHFEKKFFTSSHRVVLNTYNSYKTYYNKYPYPIAKKFTFIRNAYNVNLFKEVTLEDDSRFRFGYFGSFRKYVSSEIILKAFSQFIRSNNLKANQVALIFNGSVDDLFWNYVEELDLVDFIEVRKEVNVKDTLNVLRSWDSLLLLVSPDYKWMVPAKVYDYLAARKPIIAISDNEEVNGIIKETKSGTVASLTDVNSVAESFSKSFADGKTSLIENKQLIEPFGHATQMTKVLEVTDSVIAGVNYETKVDSTGSSCVVIIVTYNGVKWIEKCISSLYLPANPPDIVIIDNGSSDNTLEVVESLNKGNINVIINSENKGFGDANNTGLKYAYQKNYDYYFLLNQDAWIEEDTIDKLIKGIRDNNDCELTSPIHMNGAGTAFDRSFKKFVNRYKSVDQNFEEETLDQFDQVFEVGFVNAAAWMLSKKCLEEVGLFHQLFYHTGEDNNYCHRVLYKGFKIGVVTNTKIYHDREYRIDKYDPKFDFDRETIKDLAKPDIRSILKHRWIAFVKTLEICLKLKPHRIPGFMLWAHREFPLIRKRVESFDDSELYNF